MNIDAYKQPLHINDKVMFDHPTYEMILIGTIINLINGTAHIKHPPLVDGSDVTIQQCSNLINCCH